MSKKGLLILSDGYEQIEALVIHDLLKRVGANVIVVANKSDNLNIVSNCNLICKAELKISDLEFDSVGEKYDFLIIPGGGYVKEAIISEEKIPKLIEKFYENKKLIAAICAAPMFLNKAKIIKDNTPYTCYPGCEFNNGIYLENEDVVIFENIITAKAASKTTLFGYSVIEYLYGNDTVGNLKNNICDL